MKRNIGKADRLIRLSFGLAFLALAYVYQSWMIAAVGAFCLVEAMASWCLWYQLTGKNSCPIEKR